MKYFSEFIPIVKHCMTVYFLETLLVCISQWQITVCVCLYFTIFLEGYFHRVQNSRLVVIFFQNTVDVILLFSVFYFSY